MSLQGEQRSAVVSILSFTRTLIFNQGYNMLNLMSDVISGGFYVWGKCEARIISKQLSYLKGY